MLFKFISLPVSFLAALTLINASPIDTPTSPDVALDARASQNVIGDIVNLLNLGLVTNITTTLTLETLVNNLVTVAFAVKNPFIFELTIDSISSTASLNNTVYAAFSYTFPTPVVVPPLGTANSPPIPNVLLSQGATASLEIIPYEILDLAADVELRGATIKGKLGIPVELTGLKQKAVSTKYNLELA